MTDGSMWPNELNVDSKSKGLEYDSHCWSCVKVLGKLLIPFCLCLPSSDGYLMEQESLAIAAAKCANDEFSQEEMRQYKYVPISRLVTGVNCTI